MDEHTLRRVHTGLTSLFHGPRLRHLAILAIGEAWLYGYDVYPEELGAGAGIAIELCPRSSRTTDRSGRIELVADIEGAPLRWRWSDTGDVLRTAPENTEALVAEIDARLRPESRGMNAPDRGHEEGRTHRGSGP
ncbi:hypothetical protein NE857_33710 (plasmid) [Nocardiopsis exhalans]|uniref:Uncharacterized protein n=1 Tax=Nocardiopsis exhalans TaxID=163604 RepID=A0ABY5DJ50_9ACTN|nr:hypothetical protein [Nocardiopsis exhalans]USY23589.1 hypothetical protein NE857_33710 [Nocardiopsis exhalans]